MTLHKRVITKFTDSGFRGVAGATLRGLANLFDSPQDHQLNAYRTLSLYTSFTDKRVLEVGGAQACVSMIPFITAGATEGVVTGLEHISEDRTDSNDGITVLRADALSLGSTFGYSHFDIVYGLSVVEHIPTPAVFLDEIYKVLRPGGLVYLEGSPIWSAPDGHHLWVATWGGAYQRRASANYLFSPFPGHVSTNPLADWSHLLMDPSQMRQHLQAKALPETDIDCILDWVYLNQEINRLSLAELATAYGSSDLQVLEANTTRVAVPQDVHSALWSRYGTGVDYGVRSVSYVLRKPT